MAKKGKSAVTLEVAASDLETTMRNNTVPAPEPGNETDPKAKAKRNGRAKAVDLPGITGRGVAIETHDDLDEMGDELEDLRTKKSKLAEKITTVEKKALDRMAELGLTKYRFTDRIMEISEGKDHVKVKTVRTGDEDDAEVPY